MKDKLIELDKLLDVVNKPRTIKTKLGFSTVQMMRINPNGKEVEITTELLELYGELLLMMELVQMRLKEIYDE